mmetsp:Transcript_2422/g.7400  ORF Transcript_2422/g.7400 Transcript_2422/m.7400 type:complete len:233 (+) Transcript_2422:570-1268(+)
MSTAWTKLDSVPSASLKLAPCSLESLKFDLETSDESKAPPSSGRSCQATPRMSQSLYSSGCTSGVLMQRGCCHARVGAARLCFHPSALLKSALAAPTQLEKEAPSTFASANHAPCKFALLSDAPRRSACIKKAPCSDARWNLAPWRFAFVKSAPSRFPSLKSARAKEAPTALACVSFAKVSAASSNVDPPNLAWLRSAPMSSAALNDVNLLHSWIAVLNPLVNLSSAALREV